jgi:hypothetical protein
MKISIQKSKSVLRNKKNGKITRYVDFNNVSRGSERVRFFNLYPYLPIYIIIKGQVRRTIFKPYYKLRAYFLGKYNERNFTNDKKKLKLWWNEVVLRKPVYYEYFSRDCDCYEVGGYSVAKSRKEFNESQEAMWESAEGECWMKRCSKEEYEANKDVRYERDRVMEAFENGSNFYV